MDEYEWGLEYLREAQELKEHLAPLRRELRTACGEDADALYRRVSMLAEMHLELLRTGTLLTERGKAK